MTTFTLSELGCSGACDQGRLPCTCDIMNKSEPNVDIEVKATNDEQKVEITLKIPF